MKFRLSSSLWLLALPTLAFANHAQGTGNFYVGAFGGFGSSTHVDTNQYGTVFFIEANGGPLAVNAIGQLDSKNVAFLGAQLGYRGQDVCLNTCSQLTLTPALELEAFAMNKRSFNGTLNNNTDRLEEHSFAVSYPMRTTVFLANAVLGFNNTTLLVHPYIGLGIGSAIVKVSDANAAQTNPPEPGINHYNSNTNDTTSTFAGQIKIGLDYNLNECISLFAEYRWLYLASADFVLGSAVYPTHAPTSSWQVEIEPQKYHLGSIGVRFNW
ncbi:MAG: outer membrane protein [Candidatus Berkiella sp.]